MQGYRNISDVNSSLSGAVVEIEAFGKIQQRSFDSQILKKLKPIAGFLSDYWCEITSIPDPHGVKHNLQWAPWDTDNL